MRRGRLSEVPVECEQPSAGRMFWEGRRAGAKFLGRMRPDGLRRTRAAGRTCS